MFDPAIFDSAIFDTGGESTGGGGGPRGKPRKPRKPHLIAYPVDESPEEDAVMLAILDGYPW
jgi:hypothetical protein